MKSRTSFFNGTVIRKDITRFAPLWGLYFIGGVLVMLSIASSLQTVYNAREVAATIGYFNIINMIYAGIAAQLLFGDLFNSRLCNALHAMPVHREQWFVSHVLVGIGFSVVPNTLGIALVMPGMGSFWFVGLWWLLAMTLQYVFFFSVAVFSVFCTGNRFAMAVVYGMLNFASVIALWFVRTIYEPQLFGVSIPKEPFMMLCPLIYLCDKEYLLIERIDGWEAYGDAADEWVWEFRGLGDGWGYMAILGIVAVVFLALSLVMYRRRRLECAGDFMALAPMAPVFSLVFTLCAGAVFAIFGGEILGMPYLVCLTIGVLVGFFTGQMLLRRTVKVFQVKTFCRCAGLGLLIIASILLTKMDPIGITRRVPEAEQVAAVFVDNSLRSDLLYSDSSVGGIGNSIGTLLPEYWSNDYSASITDPEDIERLTQAHRQIIERGEPEDYNGNTFNITLCYVMKDGSVVQRAYCTYANGEAFETWRSLMSQGDVVLGSEDIEELCQAVKRIEYDFKVIEDKAQIRSFLEAVLADCSEGTMAQGSGFHPSDRGVKEWVEIVFKEEDLYRTIRVYEESKHTAKWLDQNSSKNDGITPYG